MTKETIRLGAKGVARSGKADEKTGKDFTLKNTDPVLTTRTILLYTYNA